MCKTFHAVKLEVNVFQARQFVRKLDFTATVISASHTFFTQLHLLHQTNAKAEKIKETSNYSYYKFRMPKTDPFDKQEKATASSLVGKHGIG